MLRSMLLPFVALAALLALWGCHPSQIDEKALRQTLTPLCSGEHVVSVDNSGPVARVRSECRPAPEKRAAETN